MKILNGKPIRKSNLCILLVLLVMFVSCTTEEKINGIEEIEANDGTFTTIWDNTTKITIPTNPDFQYNYDIDFDNDGVFEKKEQTGNITHNFSTDGPHVVRIRGKFPAIQFNSNSGEKMASKIISVEQWGNIEWESMKGAFTSCKNLEIKAKDIPDLSKVTDMSNMFRDTKFADPDVTLWDVSQVRDMSRMFRGAIKANPDMSQWNISNNLLFMEAMLNSSGITPLNYAKALINFANQADKEEINNITLNAKHIQACSFAEEAKIKLELERGWKFEDDNFVTCP